METTGTGNDDATDVAELLDHAADTALRQDWDGDAFVLAARCAFDAAVISVFGINFNPPDRFPLDTVERAKRFFQAAHGRAAENNSELIQWALSRAAREPSAGA